MRIVMLLVSAIVITSASAYAQALAPQSSTCYPISTKGQVVVTKADGNTLKDTLLCMGRDKVVLANAGEFSLDSVRQITKPRDPVWDGFIKGASVGLVILAFCLPDCPGELIARTTIGYGVLGGIIDAAQGNETTIFKRGPAPSLAWRIRF